EGKALAREATLAPRRRGELLAPEAEAVGVVARDAVLARDHLRTLELAREGIVLAIARRQRAPALHVRAERDAGHHLEPAGEDEVLDPGADEAGAERRGLLARAALAVERRRPGLERKAGGPPH